MFLRRADMEFVVDVLRVDAVSDVSLLADLVVVDVDWFFGV